MAGDGRGRNGLTEEASEVGGDLGGEGLEGDGAEFGEGFVGDDEVGGVVDRGAVGGEAEGETVEFGWRGFHGGVGFDEETVGGHRTIAGEAGSEAGLERLDVEGKIGAEVGEGFHEFDGAAVAVHEKTAGGQAGRGTEDVEGGAVGLGRVDGGGAVELGGEVELGGKDFGLLGERGDAEAGDARIVRADAVDDPAVETDLTDTGARIGEERGAKVAEPVGGAVAAVPRVHAVAGLESEGTRRLRAER